MAQKLDNNFISVYARDSPTSEDVAESLGPFLYLHRNSFTDGTAEKSKIFNHCTRINFSR